MLEVLNKTTLDTSRDRAWEVLSSFDGYKEWNPIIRQVDGELAIGSAITIHVEGPAGARPWDVTVATADTGTAFGWKFTEHASWLYRGEHVFQLEAHDGGVVLVDRERFWGLLVPLRAAKLRRNIKASMAEFSAAFKSRVETENL